jgi:hypothetical protein
VLEEIKLPSWLLFCRRTSSCDKVEALLLLLVLTEEFGTKSSCLPLEGGDRRVGDFCTRRAKEKSYKSGTKSERLALESTGITLSEQNFEIA